MPILWGFLISIRQPADAFAIPPKLIFDPTLIFHYEVWVERGFLAFPVQQPGHRRRHGLHLGADRHAGRLWPGAHASRAIPRSLLFGLLAVRMFPQILLAIPFFVMARRSSLIDTYPDDDPGDGGDQPAVHHLADAQLLPGCAGRAG